MSGQIQHSAVKTSNLPDKCPMTRANLQACNKYKGRHLYKIILTRDISKKGAREKKCFIFKTTPRYTVSNSFPGSSLPVETRWNIDFPGFKSRVLLARKNTVS